MDLNLLQVFKVLYETKHLTKAAQRLNLSQPATSAALARLRAMFDDELFFKVSGGIQATRRADDIARTVVPQYDQLLKAVAFDHVFDPAASKYIFHVGVTDYICAAAMPAVYEPLATEYPGISLYQRSLPAREPYSDLESGTLDLAIGVSESDLPHLYRRKIYSDPFVVMMRKQHPCRKLTLDSYAALGHVLVAPWGIARAGVDDALEKLGLTRHIHHTVPFFLSVADVLSNTNLVTTLPKRIADIICKTHPLKQMPVPTQLGLKPIDVSLIWHRRSHVSPPHEWLRSILLEKLK